MTETESRKQIRTIRMMGDHCEEEVTLSAQNCTDLTTALHFAQLCINGSFDLDDELEEGLTVRQHAQELLSTWRKGLRGEISIPEQEED